MPRKDGGGARWVARASVPLALCAMLGVNGCSSEDPAPAPEPKAVESPTESSGPPGTAVSGNTPCDLLTDTELSALAGEPLPEGTPANVGGLPACQWGPTERVGVQATTVPAGTWARQLPALVDRLEASGLLDAENRDKLEAARELVESGAQIAPDRACDLFTSLIVEFQGQPSGSWRVINAVPTREDPRAISGQSCRQGTFTSVLLVAPGLSGSHDEIERVATALATARKRGLD